MTVRDPQGMRVAFSPHLNVTVCCEHADVFAVPGRDRLHIASLEEHCHNSKFGIFELLV